MAEYCEQHAQVGMTNVCNRKCRIEACDRRPSFGVAGTKTAVCFRQHVPDGMVDVMHRKCRIEDCGKKAVVWSDRHKDGGVLCAARSRLDDQRLQKKVQNRRLRQTAVIRSGRYENGGVLPTARPGRDG